MRTAIVLFTRGRRVHRDESPLAPQPEGGA